MGRSPGETSNWFQTRGSCQAWRASDWPEAFIPSLNSRLQTRGAGTHLVFDQTGFPDGLHDGLAEGWQPNYWSLLKKCPSVRSRPPAIVSASPTENSERLRRNL